MAKKSLYLKIKITTSLDPNLVQAMDSYIESNKTLSRSQLVEDLIRQWYLKQKREEIEKRIEQYYTSLSEEEKNEDKDWGRMTTLSAEQLWKD